jgi:hypothetical protein
MNRPQMLQVLSTVENSEKAQEMKLRKAKAPAA